MIEATGRTPIRVAVGVARVTVVIHITQTILPMAGIIAGIGRSEPIVNPLAHPNYAHSIFLFVYLLFYISD